MPQKQPSGQLKVVPLTDDANIAEQLAASLSRIEEGLTNIGDGIHELMAKPGPSAVLRIDGPDPAWLIELIQKHAAATACGSSVCVVQRDALSNVLTLIDLSRKRR